MKIRINELLDQIKGEKSKTLKFVFGEENWRGVIPSRPGWYEIRTNAPLNVLKQVEPPPQDHKHYKFRERIEYNEQLPIPELLISQEGDGIWTVYNGYAANLKSRAREHQRGDKGTGCLAIQRQKGVNLTQYDWFFEFFLLEDLGVKDHRILRRLMEQAWRARYGWPVLCGA